MKRILFAVALFLIPATARACLWDYDTLVAERSANGPFADLADFAGRCDPTVSCTRVEGASTSDRSNSMWGEIGVNSSARWVASMIGARTEKA